MFANKWKTPSVVMRGDGRVSQAAAAGLGWSRYIWWDGHKIRNRQILSGKLTLPSDAE